MSKDTILCLFAAALLVMLLSSCSSIPEVKRVEVPVIVKCTAPPVPVPSFGYPDCLKIGNTIYEMTQCLLSDIHLHRGYESQLNAEISACST